MGTHAMIWLPNSRTAESNANFMSWTGIPAALRPSSVLATVLSPNVRDAANGPVMGQCTISSAGVISWKLFISSGVHTHQMFQTTTGFTASGTKGLDAGLNLFYPLD